MAITYKEFSKIDIKHWTLPTILIVAYFGFLLFSDSVAFRNAFVTISAECSVRQIKHMPLDTDFIAIGSSRVRRGFSLEDIESSSKFNISKGFNLGRSGINPGRSYSIFRDVIEAGVRPKYAFIELDIDALLTPSSADKIVPPDDVAILKFSDLLLLYDIRADRSKYERFHIVVEHIIKKIQKSLIFALSGGVKFSFFDNNQYPQKTCWFDGDLVQSDWKNSQIKSEYDSLQRKNGDIYRTVDDVFDGISVTWRSSQELYFLDRIRDLAAVSGTKIYVSRHWQVYQPPYSERKVDGIKSIVPEFIYPAVGVIRDSWTSFNDVTHMDNLARKNYSIWLTDVMLSNSE